MYKYLGLLMVMWSWVSGAYMLRKWRGTHDMSISKHAASAMGAYKVFSVTLVLGGLGFYIWILTWFSENLNLGLNFKVLITLVFIGQVVSAIIPDSHGWKSIVHRIAAYSMAFLYIPTSYVVLRADNYSPFTTIFCVLGISYMIFAFVLFTFYKKSRSRYLIFQALYILYFQLIFIAAAYIG